MGTFPPTVAPQGASPSPGGAQGGSPAIKLAMLGQLIQGMAQQFPQGQQGIKMMMDGLRLLQQSASAQSTPPQPAAPPR
ncbi:MAG: hypothetical protein KGL39_19235 [Patescibacteria group bacterium]|nr:hypothetical protein [Patescibacteria group bacterium]